MSSGDYADLEDFFDPNLYLKIGGKVYTILAPTGEAGLRLHTMFKPGSEQHFKDDDEIEEYKLLLGAAWDELMADGVPWPSICRAGRTALMHYTLGPTLAELNWITGMVDEGNPLPAEPMNRAAKRAAKKAPAKKAASSKARTARTTPARARTAKATPAAATTTPQPDSATGTTPPQSQ